jgi:opine dehydrogenase
VTLDIKEALKDAQIINVVIPAFGHDLFFEEMIPFLREGQVVVIWAGDFGSLRLLKLLKEKNENEKKVIIAETNTLTYGCRLKGPACVELLLSAPKVIISALPGADTPKLEVLKKIWPALERADNVIEVALSNPNPICHPPGAILNVGRIQYAKEFYMYKEGITEAVARVIKAVYDETAALASGFGFEVLQYEEREFKTTTSIMGVAFQAPFDTIGVIASVLGPTSIYDRYITEDLPYGLVPISQLGDKLEVPTPLIDAFINIGSVICQENFWETGRTLKTLGIEDMSKEEIIQYVRG